MSRPASRNSWAWVPSLYFAEGIPYVVVMLVSVVMYKRLGVSNTEIALYTSWLYLPWVIKPLWSPFVDTIKTKRFWIVSMQLLIGAGLAGVALTLPGPDFLRYSLAFLWLLAFSSATHDIAADGFYMLGLSTHDQAWFVGIRSTFYRLAMITGQGLLVILAGYLETATGLEPVRLAVEADPSATTVLASHPDSVAVPSDAQELRLTTLPASLTMGTQTVQAGTADSLVAFAREWNERHGFVSTEDPTAPSQQVDEPSWWSRLVSAPLERLLRKTFGAVTAADEGGESGNTALAYLYVQGSIPDGESIVVNLSREEGDASVRLVEGSRIVFDQSNANRPAILAIQLDPKLDNATSAQIVGRSGNIPLAWSITFYVLAGFFVVAFLYHKFILPYPPEDVPVLPDEGGVLAGFIETFASFFRKEGIGVAVAFLLLFRFAEAQLVKLASPFLLDSQQVGGLALTTGEVGFVYGTVGVASLTVGGILGGFLAARNGLKYWLWPMVIAINIPNAVYVYLSLATPESLTIINACVAIEQFGYGFGFTAYMLYMIYIAEGHHKTAHFAICTGFMALGMMIPGMFSGWLQDIIGYEDFFIWVVIATIPGFIVTALIKIDPRFGVKEENDQHPPDDGG